MLGLALCIITRDMDGLRAVQGIEGIEGIMKFFRSSRSSDIFLFWHVKLRKRISI